MKQIFHDIDIKDEITQKHILLIPTMLEQWQSYQRAVKASLIMAS